MKNSFILLLALGLASCAAPKAKIIYQAPEGFYDKKEDIAPSLPTPPTTKPALPTAGTDGGMRIGDDILALPEESQLRATAPDSANKGDAPVIARPPKR